MVLTSPLIPARVQVQWAPAPALDGASFTAVFPTVPAVGTPFHLGGFQLSVKEVRFEHPSPEAEQVVELVVVVGG